MQSLEELGTVLTTDLLIVGGGFGGLWAAIKAKERLPSVTVVDEGLIGWSGHSHFASGVLVSCLPQDDLELWTEDILKANDDLADAAEIKAVLQGSYERIRDLEGWGVDFHRGRDGQYERIASRGTRAVQLLIPEEGGKGMLLALRSEALRRGVTLVDNIFISDLLTDSKGRVVGGVGLHRRKGGFHIFLAGAMVIATNGGGFRGHHLASELQGTGPFMAFDIGAELSNVEFNLQNIRPSRYEVEGSGILPAYGARWVNALGEHFMEKYDPELKDRAELQPILTAMVDQYRQGKAPISLDTPAMDPEKRERFMFHISKGWLSTIHKKVIKEDRDYLRERVEWKPVYEFNRGGIFADRECRVRGVPGLFVGGKAKAFDPAALTGWSIARCFWSGFVAGQSAATYAADAGPALAVDVAQVAQLKERLYHPLSRRSGVLPDRILRKLQKALFPYDVLIVQREDRLKEALTEVERLRDADAPRLYARDTHELVKLREVQTMVVNAEMTLQTSLMRRETRPHIFCREDYPERDDRNWRRWILIKKSGDGGMEFHTKPIPGTSPRGRP